MNPNKVLTIRKYTHYHQTEGSFLEYKGRPQTSPEHPDHPEGHWESLLLWQEPSDHSYYLNHFVWLEEVVK